MSDQRDGGIGWTDESWNPIRGCTRVSPGCGGARGVGGCYAERVAARFSNPGQPYHGLAVMGEHGPRWTGKVVLVEKHLTDPLKWKRPRRVFVNSMSDLFHERLMNSEIDAVFAVMALAPQHTFQILTKRPARMLDYFSAPNVWARIEVSARQQYKAQTGQQIAGKTLIGPLPHVWLGVSAEDQQRAAERIPLLQRTPAAVRFVSIEPQLGYVDIVPWLGIETSTRPALDWVICGAESGPGARPFNLDWARSLRDQCAAAGVAFFGKQDADARGRKLPLLLDGVETKEFPR